MIEKDIKVSVVIPVYNALPYLKECMDSVLAQSLEGFEIICINDGSTDDSLTSLRKYALADERIKIITKDNRGYGHTVNLGIRQAEGEYISIIEPDDYIEKDMLQTLYETAKQYELDVVSADYRWFYDEAGRRVFEKHVIYNDRKMYGKVLDPRKDIKVVQGQYINPAGLFRKKFLLERNIVHNETAGAAFQDRGFCFLSLIQAERLMVLSCAFYNYRHDNPASSISGRNDIDKVIMEYRMTLDKLLKMDDAYREYFPEFFRREYESCRYALSRSYNYAQKEALYKISEEFRNYENEGILDAGGMQTEMKNELYFVMYSPKEAYCSFSGLKDEIHESLLEFDSFVIYGAGVVGKRIFKGLSVEDRKKCMGFAVSNRESNLTSMENYPIKCIEEYIDKRENTAVVVAVTKKYRDEIMERLSILGFQNIIIPQSMGAAM
ncbi:MAG: glycosyltransferase [Lachnospiraceae bacterium]|nr:glycosyltransferase [Lachnospiraceae bacterium]